MDTRPAHIRDAYTIMVCQCCMLSHVDGECCTEEAPHHTDDHTPCFEGAFNCYRSHSGTVMGVLLHNGDGREPLSLISDDDGLASADFDEDDQDPFTHTPCEGCGSGLHGDRYPMTVFPGERLAPLPVV